MIRELVEEGEIELVKIHTKENQANALTKTLLRDNFLKCVVLVGLMDWIEFAKPLENQGRDCKLRCSAPKPWEIK